MTDPSERVATVCPCTKADEWTETLWLLNKRLKNCFWIDCPLERRHLHISYPVLTPASEGQRMGQYKSPLWVTCRPCWLVYWEALFPLAPQSSSNYLHIAVQFSSNSTQFISLLQIYVLWINREGEKTKTKTISTKSCVWWVTRTDIKRFSLSLRVLITPVNSISVSR